MADETVRALDATDTTQILVALQTWINGLKDPETDERLLSDKVYLEYQQDGMGFCIKGNGGAVLDEDIAGNFSAEVPFMIYYTTTLVPDGDGEIFKPLTTLQAWFSANGTTGLQLGARRTPDSITTLKGPTDLAGPDDQGRVTFFSVYALTYDEEAL